MRKLFTMIALSLLCVGGVKAQTKYSFDLSAMSESDLTITNGSYANNKITADAATLDADGGKVPTVMTVQVKDYPITFTYKNTGTSGKDVFTYVLNKKYLQANSKNTTINITGLNVGDIVEVEYSGKSSTEEDIAGELTGLTADESNGTSKDKAKITSKYYATATTASIQETNNGYLLYSITVTPSDYDPWADVHEITEKTQIMLDQTVMEGLDWINATSDGWSGTKAYGPYSGNFVNMSKAARLITMTLKGAKKFEVYVQNTGADRTYDITVGTTTTKITHGATGVESSGAIDCDENGCVIKIAGDGSGSVYPVGVVFYVDEPTVSLSIPACGLATLISDKNIDLANLPSGVEAYIIPGYNTTKTAFAVKQLTEAVPANTALLFKGAAGSYELPIAASASELTETNKLKGESLKTKNMTEKANATFVLNPSTGKFVVCSGGTLLPGKAYVDLNPADAATASAKGAMGIDLDFTEGVVVTGINAVETTSASQEIYNLNGVRVASPLQKGVYIVNGKKVVR